MHPSEEAPMPPGSGRASGVRGVDARLEELLERTAHLLARARTDDLAAGGTPQLIALRLAREQAQTKLLKLSAWAARGGELAAEARAAAHEVRATAEAVEALYRTRAGGR